MKHNQTLTDNGVQVALFPMEHLNMSQGRYGTFSHSGYNAYDLTGKDTGIDKFFAPFDLFVEWVDKGTHKTGLVLSNLTKVLMANGKVQAPKTIKIMLWHDNDIRGIERGQIFVQGEHFYDEGTAGFATGNHVHLELAYGVYDQTMYPLYQLNNGYWTLRGIELNIEDCFFINDTEIIETAGYKFKTFIPNKVHEHIPEKWGFTANTRINKRKYHDTTSKVLGFVEAGQTIEYIEKYNDENHVWVNTGDYWLAVREVKAGVRQTPWGKLHAPVVKTKEYITLLKAAGTYTFHPHGQKPTDHNISGRLNPGKFGNLEYEVLDRPYTDVVTIQRKDHPKAKVNLFIGKGTERFWKIIRR